jgi:hypothetical protein
MAERDYTQKAVRAVLAAARSEHSFAEWLAQVLATVAGQLHQESRDPGTDETEKLPFGPQIGRGRAPVGPTIWPVASNLPQFQPHGHGHGRAAPARRAVHPGCRPGADPAVPLAADARAADRGAGRARPCRRGACSGTR